MKKLLTASWVLALVLAGCQSPPSSSELGAAPVAAVQTKETQTAMTPQAALARLKAGNARFVAGETTKRDLMAQAKATASGQYPYAVILSCIDSRQPVEMIFDQGIGDVFNARVAGNVINDDVLGSMEYACEEAGSKLIVVMGHSSCGAIKGAVDHIELGNLTGLLEKIKPAIREAAAGGPAGDSHDKAFVQKVSEANVHLVTKEIEARSPVLRELLEKKHIAIVGAMYDLETGHVTFYEEH